MVRLFKRMHKQRMCADYLPRVYRCKPCRKVLSYPCLVFVLALKLVILNLQDVIKGFGLGCC